MPQSPTKPFSRIFLSYRRADSSGHTGRLFDKLVDLFGQDQIFMDVDMDIQPGEDFVTAIENAVGSCGILIAIIGRYWLSSGDDTSRRLDNPNDYVRLEIGAALNRGIQVIPVLVQGATMPGPQDLPDELSKLSRRQAYELSDVRWKRDVDRLIEVLQKALAARIRAEEDAKRQAEEELRAREAEEAHRVAEDARVRREAKERAEAQARQKAKQLAARKRAKVQAARRKAEELARAEQVARAEDARRQRVNLPPPVLYPIGSTVAEEQASGSTGRPISAGPQIEMVLVPAGMFTMGSPDSEFRHHSDEAPKHLVSVQRFYMGKYEVSQAQYHAVMGEPNPSNFKGDNLPVERVSWNDAVEFCWKLSQMTGKEYRLPSEAEWEYACRARTETPFSVGSSLSSKQANFDGNYPYGGAAPGADRAKTTPVGSFPPNAFGLNDMHGNVWEWCLDWYHETYNGAPTDGSAWLTGGEQKGRVIRGGSWRNKALSLRSAFRFFGLPGSSGDDVGFRVVAVARTQEFSWLLA